LKHEPARKSLKEHWDAFWERSGDVDSVYSNDGRVSAHLLEILSPEGRKILEVGAGSGRDGIFMAREGASVVSLDYSLQSLHMIKAQISERDTVSLCCGDAFSLPFADEAFDVVFHQGLLEHFRDPEDIVAENMRVLKHGGYLLVDVPQRFHYYTAVKHLMIALGKWFAGWETEYTVGQLERFLERYSFSIVTSYGEWLNPPIWYRMLRRGLIQAGIRLPMYPRIFTMLRKGFAGLRSRLLRRRWTLYTTLVIGSIARKR
jgi:ubiquinone/menaquinone biosynthesis C-methylase UbiE